MVWLECGTQGEKDKGRFRWALQTRPKGSDFSLRNEMLKKGST